jgi:hypothetical protein
MNVEEARDVLRNAGYYVDMLWHIDDVDADMSAEDKQAILRKALNNEWLIENTNELINDELND